MDRLDFVIFGATGFTGYYCVRNLLKINSEKNKNYSFAIAGRSKEKLRSVLEEVSKELGQDTSAVKLIEADVDNRESISNMTKQCKVLITVVGPYTLYGRSVIEECVENGTHYVDLTGEAQFSEKVQTDLYDKAKEKGLYIVSSCGFDSIPADLSCLFLKDQFPDVEFKSVEAYILMKTPKGFTVNTGTFFSMLESIRNYKEIRPIRTAMFDKFYKKKVEIEKPGLRLLPHSAPFAKKGYFVPFWQVDAAVVKRTQLFFYNDNENDKPLSLTEYMHIPSLVHGFGMLLALISILFFNLFSFTRNLLKKYPKCFTLGIFGAGGPTREQVNASSFEMFFNGKGHKKDSPSTKVTKTVYVKGPEAAYDATSIALLNSAMVILDELDGKNKSNCGVVTPGYAFRHTNYIERIRDLGLEWKVV